jgi:hypothetical protein
MFIFAFGLPSRMHHRTRETFGPDGRTPGPVQTYHLGLWFNSPDDAAKAGCPTPAFRYLNTSNFLTPRDRCSY